MAMHITQFLPAVMCGALVGLLLGLTGGGGSVLALPLLIYVVGVSDVHRAIGTAALAVALSALTNLFFYMRMRAVAWRCAATYGALGVLGAALGSTISKEVNGRPLLIMFSFLMMAVAFMMARNRALPDAEIVKLNRGTFAWLMILGLATGFISGFFGIGGGFMILPGLIFCTGMPILTAVGSSLVVVALFGLSAAINYAASGWVDFNIALVFMLGSLAGGYMGRKGARSLAERNGLLHVVFALILFAVAIYILVRAVSQGFT
jgi:uncharacterized membrane protein YfcA